MFTGVLLSLLSPIIALQTCTEETVNQQALKTDLLVVTAHPDDESMMAGALARYADQGKVVALVSFTRGEGGGNGTGKESGAALGAVREAELRKCLAILGVRHLYFLDCNDFGYTESLRATLRKWGRDESLARLVRLVRLLRPDVVATMDPAPVGGQHGHHQAAGRLATEAFDAAADADAFPQLARDEGLAPWRVSKLYWSSFDGPSSVAIATDGLATGTLAATAPGKTFADISRSALRHHRSQGFDKFLDSLAASGQPPARPTRFLLVKSRIAVNTLEEMDLFDGITGAGGPDANRDLLSSLPPPKVQSHPVTIRIRARDNIENYRDWLRSNGIARLMTRLPAHVTAVAGRSDNRVEVAVTNQTAERRTGTVSLEMASGLAAAEREVPFDAPARGTATVAFQVKVPAGAGVGTHDLTAEIGKPASGNTSENSTATGAGKLEVVPSLTITRLAAALPVDGDASKWERAGASPSRVPHTNVVQGRVAGPDECSGRFFIGHDGHGLQVLVDVTDNVIARNIAADDIKAHWRSTSVEICIDPKPPSENTLTTLKLGIFPQDADGRVRAARDADARPGELKRIDSKIRLASLQTAAGYTVEAYIPWCEVGFAHDSAPASGHGLGFNVIIYHAGKVDARIGEDVGKARLAWSYWPGVPGRPEVWGRAWLP
jgi:LmbE family N-acetylglucosaminyl deacetylase